MVQLENRATERQKKYLGYLSNKGKEKFGEDFSIRKLAESRGINWDTMSQGEASKLIGDVKSMVEDIILETKEGQGQSQATSQSSSYIIHISVDSSKINALKIVLDAMGIDYLVLKEARG